MIWSRTFNQAVLHRDSIRMVSFYMAYLLAFLFHTLSSHSDYQGDAYNHTNSYSQMVQRGHQVCSSAASNSVLPLNLVSCSDCDYIIQIACYASVFADFFSTSLCSGLLCISTIIHCNINKKICNISDFKYSSKISSWNCVCVGFRVVCS